MVNAGGTVNLLEAIRACPEPPSLVYTSTNKVYGALEDVPLVRESLRYVPAAGRWRTGIDEKRPLQFLSPYGCSKGVADQYVLDYAHSYALPAVVFRMSCIYGPCQFGTEDQGWVAHFILRSLTGEPITICGDGLQVRDLLYVDDLVDAFLIAQARMADVRGRAFNIGGGPAHTRSLLELLELLATLDHRRPAVAFAPARLGDQRYYVSNHRQFSRATGWQPKVSVDEGVRRVRSWLLEHLEHESVSAGVPALMAAVPPWSFRCGPYECRHEDRAHQPTLELRRFDLLWMPRTASPA
jgi:CDP-paratose 2-epimerase